MSNGEKVISQIPDVWFDVYARIFPGLYFVFGSYYVTGRDLGEFEWKTGLASILAAYVVGHATQPLSSAVARRFRRKHGSDDRRYLVDAIYGSNSREAHVLSKQRAECAGMAAFAIFSVFLFLLSLAMDVWIAPPESDDLFVAVKFVVLAVLFVAFLAGTKERARKIRSRIDLYIETDAERERRKARNNEVNPAP